MFKKVLGLVLAIVFVFSLAACSASTTEDNQTIVDSIFESTETSTQAETDAAVSSDSTDASSGASKTAANVTSTGVIDASDLFTDRDLTQSADLSSATSYTVRDSENINITEEGVYVLSGAASNVTVTVEVEDNEKVQIVLDGVTITNTSAPVIYVKNADKVFVTTTSTENTLSVTSSFTSDGDTNTDAVIFSKDDLVLNGTGTLNISSTDNGITSKDDLKVTGGTINITCTSDAIEANDSIAVSDGSITINTSKDALHAENDDDNSKGYIYICGGTFNINAGSDGIQGTTVVQIDGGTFNINASEGIEGTYVQINDGTINITASDDGINGSNKSSAYNVTVEINGGSITIDMGQGDTDAIDSNGNLYITGGTINITAQSPFDYDGEGKKTGGTVIVNGEETDELTNQMMGGPGGMGGGMQGGPGGMQQGGMQGGMGGFGH